MTAVIRDLACFNLGLGRSMGIADMTVQFITGVENFNASATFIVAFNIIHHVEHCLYSFFVFFRNRSVCGFLGTITIIILLAIRSLIVACFKRIVSLIFVRLWQSIFVLLMMVRLRLFCLVLLLIVGIVTTTWRSSSLIVM